MLRQGNVSSPATLLVVVPKLRDDSPDRSYFSISHLLFNENRLLVEQNNESNSRRSIRSTMVGKAKVMSYEDTEEAQVKRDVKEATVFRGKRGPKRKSSASILAKAKGTRRAKWKLLRMRSKQWDGRITALSCSSDERCRTAVQEES